MATLEELRNRARASITAAESARVALLPKLEIQQAEPEIPRDSLSTEDTLIRDFFQSHSLEWNAEQAHYIKLCMKGENCILIGAAGTGKTTVQGITAQILLHAGKLHALRESTKWLESETPGMVIISFTNKAVNNIRWKMPKELQGNCITIHKLLEFAPVWYEVEADDGTIKKSMRFEPQRNKFNPLPSSISKVVIEESSMVGTDLYAKLLDALPHNPQIILLGDINQLPPVYDSAILGFKMLEWPIVELSKIFRQAAESPIISFAWDIKNGKELSSREVFSEVVVAGKKRKRRNIPSFDAKYVENKLTLRPWQLSKAGGKLSDTEALFTAVQFFNKLHDQQEYNPDEDIILIPFNKAFGSIELNNGIAEHLGNKRNALVHEIIAGFKKHYLAVGDKVMYQKEDCYIEDIVQNAEYLGKPFQRASKTLDRWGHQKEVTSTVEYEDALSSSDAVDKFLEAAVNSLDKDGEDRTTVASHTVVLRRTADGLEIELDTAGEVNNLIGGYAITIHKAQGSEWRKVFCVFHHSHAVMLCREILYTAITRARESLYIICEPNTFEKGVQSQRIKGTTLAEKAEYFKGKQDEMEAKIQERDDTLTTKPLKVKVEDLVQPQVKAIAAEKLDVEWKRAAVMFGDKIGKKPFLSFNLARQNAIGCANFGTGTIKLNAVYLAAGDSFLVEHMLHDTIIHEICHHVAAKLYKEYGHKFWWKQCMSKMGIRPERVCPESVPPYLQSKVELVNKKFEELRGQRDITPIEEGDIE